MDVESLVDSFNTSVSGTYTVTRHATTGFVRGRPLPTVDSTFPIEASVQPSTGKDLLILPELRRSQQRKILFTSTRLGVGGQQNVNEADTVSIDGDDWMVIQVQDWQQRFGAPGYRCLIQEVNP